MTPALLWKVYDVTEATSRVRGSSQAVVEFQNAYYSASDLQQFEREYVPAIMGTDVYTTFGSTENAKTSLEANLDVQYIMGMGNFVNTSIYLQEITTNIEDAFIEYAELANSQDDPPLVHSISFGQYGGNYPNRTVQRFKFCLRESRSFSVQEIYTDNLYVISLLFICRLNTQFQMMGEKGISILLASGDNGVGCNRQCTSFEFDFPSSPYITMV